MEMDRGDAPNARDLIRDIAGRHPSVPQLQFVRDEGSVIEVTELTDGQINYVFRIRSRDRQWSVVIKHAESRVKNVPEFLLPRDRVIAEYNALRHFNSIVSGLCPQPYCLDTLSYTVVMEDLGESRSLRDALYDGHVDEAAARDLALGLARVHSATSRDTLEPEQWAHLTDCFSKDEMKHMKGTFSFDNALDEQYKGNRFNATIMGVFRSTAQDVRLKQYFSHYADIYRDRRDCLIHADLHQASIFLRNTGPCAVGVLDMEFSCLGPRMYDLSTVLTSYAHFYFYYWEKERPDLKKAIKKMCTSFCDAYFSACSRDDDVTRSWLPELAGFTTCFLFRSVYSVTIDSLVKLKPETVRVTMETSMRCLKDHQKISTVHEFIERLLPDNLEG